MGRYVLVIWGRRQEEFRKIRISLVSVRSDQYTNTTQTLVIASSFADLTDLSMRFSGQRIHEAAPCRAVGISTILWFVFTLYSVLLHPRNLNWLIFHLLKASI
jgi:hypothetical protein